MYYLCMIYIQADLFLYIEAIKKHHIHTPNSRRCHYTILQIRSFPVSTVLIKREQEEKKELVLPNEVKLTIIKNYWKKTKLGKYKSSEYKNKLLLFEVNKSKAF